MTNEEKQKYIDAISTKMRSIAEGCDESLQFEYDVLKLALAALTTPQRLRNWKELLPWLTVSARRCNLPAPAITARSQ